MGLRPHPQSASLIISHCVSGRTITTCYSFLSQNSLRKCRKSFSSIGYDRRSTKRFHVKFADPVSATGKLSNIGTLPCKDLQRTEEVCIFRLLRASQQHGLPVVSFRAVGLSSWNDCAHSDEVPGSVNISLISWQCAAVARELELGRSFHGERFSFSLTYKTSAYHT